MEDVEMTPEQVDDWSRRLWETSQAGRMVIALAGEIQEVVEEMRAASGLHALCPSGDGSVNDLFRQAAKA